MMTPEQQASLDALTRALEILVTAHLAQIQGRPAQPQLQPPEVERDSANGDCELQP
jgi:hypothetical protein